MMYGRILNKVDFKITSNNNLTKTIGSASALYKWSKLH